MKDNETTKQNLIKTCIQFIKFGIVGVGNTLISYVTYTLLVLAGVYYIIANIIGFIVSTLNSFYWNNRYVFTKEKNEKRNIWAALVKTYISYGFTGIILENVLLYLLVDIAGVSKFLAPVVILLATVPLNFLLNKFWSFRGKKESAQKPQLSKDEQHDKEGEADK